MIPPHPTVGQDSAVYIATCYGLAGPGSYPVGGGSRFSETVQTGPGAYSASYTMGAESLSLRHSGRGVALTTHHHLAPRLKKE